MIGPVCVMILANDALGRALNIHFALFVLKTDLYRHRFQIFHRQYANDIVSTMRLVQQAHLVVLTVSLLGVHCRRPVLIAFALKVISSSLNSENVDNFSVFVDIRNHDYCVHALVPAQAPKIAKGARQRRLRGDVGAWSMVALKGSFFLNKTILSTHIHEIRVDVVAASHARQ